METNAREVDVDGACAIVPALDDDLIGVEPDELSALVIIGIAVGLVSSEILRKSLKLNDPRLIEILS